MVVSPFFNGTCKRYMRHLPVRKYFDLSAIIFGQGMVFACRPHLRFTCTSAVPRSADTQAVSLLSACRPLLGARTLLAGPIAVLHRRGSFRSLSHRPSTCRLHCRLNGLMVACFCFEGLTSGVGPSPSSRRRCVSVSVPSGAQISFPIRYDNSLG